MAMTSTTTMIKATSETDQIVASFTTLPGIKQTTSGTYVVSLVVEIVSCNDLQAGPLLKASLMEPYVKVKLAKPNSKKQHAMADIHKTKSIDKT
jgi:hypothetical protein